MRRTVAMALVLVVLVSSETLHAQKLTTASVAMLKQWIGAVTTHTPGVPDAAVAATASMTYEQRYQLNLAMPLFRKVLRSEPVGCRDDLSCEVIDRTNTVRTSPGPERFLERAAILHADAAIFAARFTPPIDDVPLTPEIRHSGDLRSRAEPPPALLSVERLAIDKDGEVRGQVLANWNWPFARSLLDMLLPGENPALGREAAREFVVAWYHATNAYLFGSGLYGEMTNHLAHAAILFPDEADVLFDRGCYAEIMGLPIHQVLAGDRHVTLPSEEKTNEQAERLLARAVLIDPSYTEARIRLGRLLGLHGRHEDAAAQLDAALALKPAGELAYYAHLFAAREARALSRLDDAARHYRAATALFPQAQSALIGASQVGLLLGDLPAARAPLQQLGIRTATGGDPWWNYQRATGREVNRLMSELHARLGS